MLYKMKLTILLMILPFWTLTRKGSGQIRYRSSFNMVPDFAFLEVAGVHLKANPTTSQGPTLQASLKSTFFHRRCSTFPLDHYNLNSTNLLDCLGFSLTFDFVSPGIFVLVLPTPFCVGFFLTEDSYYVEPFSSVWIDLFFIHNSFEISISHGM